MSLSWSHKKAKDTNTQRIEGHVKKPEQSVSPSTEKSLSLLQGVVGNQAIASLIQSHLSRLGQDAANSFERKLLDAAPAAPREVIPPEGEHILKKLPGGLLPKVHRGGRAGELLADAGTDAVAVGRHIVLAPSAPDLASHEGQQLLAHEAIHVAQQHGTTPKPQGLRAQRESAESEANKSATGLVAGIPVTQVSTAPMIHFQGAGTVVANVAKRALKWLAKRGRNISAHIAKRHIARRIGKSRFAASGKQVKKWTTRTLKDHDNVVDQGRRIIFEKQFGNDVGKGGERIVRVVVDKATGKIVTAFPTKTFKRIVTVAAIGTATAKASEADAAILARRKAIKEAEEARETFFTKFIDFIFSPSRIARDEDILAEQRIIDERIKEAIDAIEQEMKRSLNPEERAEVREIILIEMQTEPEAG